MPTEWNGIVFPDRKERRNQYNSGDGSVSLSPMQKRYVEEVLANPGGNHTSAARRAGYATATATQSAIKNDANPLVQKAIEKGMKNQLKRFEITSDRILQELCKVAFAELGDTVKVSETGDILRADDTPVEMSVEVGPKGVTKKAKTIRSADKVAALVQIGKHIGMFKDQVEVSGNLSLIDLIQQSFSEDKPSK